MNHHFNRHKLLCATALGLGVLALSGCATVSTLAEHHSLEASTKMSSSIFLDPVANADHLVFVQVHNTTDKGSMNLQQGLDQAITDHGWRVVDDPAQAKVILQVNVLQAGKIKKDALQSALAGGYGGVLGSGAVGAGVAALSGANAVGVGSAGLAVGAADWVGSMLVSDVTYSVITDVRVLQRGANGQTFTVHHNVNSNSNDSGAQSTATSRAQVLGALFGVRPQGQSSATNTNESTGESYNTQSQYMIHQTRVVSFANQANLDWKDAEPVIRKGLINTLSGLF